MVVDVHAHLGYDYVFDVEETEAGLLDAHTRYGVHVSIVQPFISRPYLSDMVQYHDRIHALCTAHPGAFYGMASINPHLRPEEYYLEAQRCVKELHFVGLKITPIAHAAPPDGIDGRYVFETASQLGVPVMVHTGSGIPFSDPARLLRVVPDFPHVPIVAAHAGGDLFVSQALYLAERFENVYLEPSGLGTMNVLRVIRAVGASRLMFSSDHAVNIPVELAKYRALLSGTELERVLSGTAREVFKLPV